MVQECLILTVFSFYPLEYMGIHDSFCVHTSVYTHMYMFQLTIVVKAVLGYKIVV